MFFILQNENYKMAFSLGTKQSVNLFAKNIISSNHYYILKTNLGLANASPTSRFKMTIKKIEDYEQLIPVFKELDPLSRKELYVRLQFLNAGFKNCYAAFTNDGKIVFLQWLIEPFENGIIHKYYRQRFYPLKDNQVMIENAFTFPKYRGYGLLPFVTQRIMAIAKDSGYKTCLSYIKKDNIASLNEFMNMGFKIVKIVKEYKFMGNTIRKL